MRLSIWISALAGLHASLLLVGGEVPHYPSGAYTYASADGTPHCDGITFTASGGILTGTHPGSCLHGGVGPYLTSGALGVVSKYAPEVPSDPHQAFIVAGDSYLYYLRMVGFYVVDTLDMEWALYINNGATSLSDQGILLPGAPPDNADATPSFGVLTAVQNQSSPSGQGYKFIFTGYCDGMSFTVSGGLATGLHTGSCIYGPFPIAGGANRTKVAPESPQAPEPVYTISEPFFVGYQDPDLGFYILDVVRKTWSVWLNIAGNVTLINEGTLTPGEPPAHSGGTPSTMKRY